MVKTAKSKIEDTVMNQISKHDVQMHSRLYFVLLNIILIVSLAGVLILGSIFLSILVSDVNVGRELDLPAFGVSGLREFLWRFPWVVTALTAIAGISVYYLIKKFSFTYRHGFYVIIGAIMLSLIGLSLIVSTTGLDDQLAGRGPFKGLATFRHLADESFYNGTISAINGSELKLDTASGMITVIISDQTHRPPGFELKVGDEISVIGNLKDGIIQADGIRHGQPLRRGRGKGVMLNHEINNFQQT
jgi:hypothetical protein